MDIWVVVEEDRHAEVEVTPFAAEEPALEAARRAAAENARDDGVEEGTLTPEMIRDGWVLYLEYGAEGDCVRVVRRTLGGNDG